jgi:hypothetical protein
MTTLKTNAIEPEGATTNLTVGMTGQNVVVGGSGGIKANTFKDAGGNTLWTSNGSGVLSSVSGFGGDQVLISSQTASNSASISFTSGIDSTYKEYVFEFYNMNPVTDSVYFEFQVNATDDPGGGYDTSLITSAHFTAEHEEDDNPAAFLDYWGGGDSAQSANDQRLTDKIGNGGDEGCAGELHLFNPASTTYVKPFYARVQYYHDGDRSICSYAAGYINDTTAIDDIQFKMSSGNINAGKIKMYGVK